MKKLKKLDVISKYSLVKQVILKYNVFTVQVLYLNLFGKKRFELNFSNISVDSRSIFPYRNGKLNDII